MTDFPPITFYTYAMSPYAAKLHGMLLYKELPFDIHFVDPLRAKKELPIGHQVPVLTVGEESRADSTPIAIWIDELFPDQPRLLPDDPDTREKLLAIDDWATHHLIPSTFRTYPGEGPARWVNGWKLSHVMGATAHRGLPWLLRWLWPAIVPRVPFARRMIAMAAADGDLSIKDAKFKLYDDFIAHLDGGPFLGGQDKPHLPDFSCYPQFALFWILGFRGADDILQRPELMAWLERMRPFVDRTPPVPPYHVWANELPARDGDFWSPTLPKFSPKRL